MYFARVCSSSYQDTVTRAIVVLDASLQRDGTTTVWTSDNDGGDLCGVWPAHNRPVPAERVGPCVARWLCPVRRLQGLPQRTMLLARRKTLLQTRLLPVWKSSVSHKTWNRSRGGSDAIFQMVIFISPQGGSAMVVGRFVYLARRQGLLSLSTAVGHAWAQWKIGGFLRWVFLLI